LKNNLDIIFLLPSFSGGGAERVALNLLTELHNRSYSVGVVVFDRNGPLLSMIPDGVPIYSLDSFTLRSSIIPLIKKIRKLNPKVILSTLGYINVALLLFRFFLPKKTKIWIREANLPSISLPNNPHPKLMNILYRLLYKKSDRLICTSERMKNEFILDFFIPESIITILPNPVDTEMIKSSISPIERFDNEGVCYVASGRLTYQKGFDQLLRWFSVLNNKTATLVILGDGDDKSKLIQQSNDLNIQDQVKFIGFCKNPWKWYAGADVFLLSSRWEGLPNVVLESLTCGTPVIATSESGGIAEIASQVKIGSLIVTSTPSIFINEMLKIKPNPSKKMKVSLLPKIYNIKHSVSILERLMRY